METTHIGSRLLESLGLGHHTLLIAHLSLLLLAFLARLLHLDLHATGKNYLAEVCLNLHDTRFFQLGAHRVKMHQILMQLFLSYVYDELLTHAVASHVSLDGSGVHIFVCFDQIDDVIFVARSFPGVFNFRGSLYTLILQSPEHILGDKSTSMRLDLDGSAVLHH